MKLLFATVLSILLAVIATQLIIHAAGPFVRLASIAQGAR